MHAIDAQKAIIELMSEIDDTSPVNAREGRILVLLNALGAEISYDENAKAGFVNIAEAKKWLAYAIDGLPGCVAMMGNYGSEENLK